LYTSPFVWLKAAIYIVMVVIYALAANGIIRHPPPTYIQTRFAEPLTSNWGSIGPRLTFLWFFLIYPMFWFWFPHITWLWLAIKLMIDAVAIVFTFMDRKRAGL